MLTVFGLALSWRVAVLVAVILAVMVFEIVPLWRILRRAGFSGWWSLLRFVPLAHLVFFWVFAFAPWPALDERR
ncbi:MAG TPA: hypothetical protein VHZ78_03195 [Rhizomicrobium sp.]|jgi:hypothetical protein|nr:hypothetical protein [Rhizomicrobium sp.]